MGKAHALQARASKGLFSMAQGGKFEQGFMAGGFSSLSGFMTSGLDDEVSKIIAGAVVGGTAEEIGGGKFANGAVTGAFTVMYNHMMHDAFLKLSIKNMEEYEQLRNFGKMYNSESQAFRMAKIIASSLKIETKVITVINNEGDIRYYHEPFYNKDMNTESYCEFYNLRCLTEDGYTMVAEDHFSIRDCSKCSVPSYYTVSKEDFRAAQCYKVPFTHHTIGLGSWTIVGPLFLTSKFLPENIYDYNNPLLQINFNNAKYGE
jgi:hypothetical protein